MLAAGLAAFSLLYCTQALLPAIGSSFGVSPTLSSLTVSVGTAAIAVAMLPMSSVADSLGRPKVMRIGLAMACVLTLASALAPQFWLLLVTRALTGVALASVVAVAMGHLVDELHPHRIAPAIGLYVSGTTVGGVLGRLVPGIVQDHASWRVAVAVLVLCSSVAVVVFSRLLPPARHLDRPPLRLSAHAAAIRTVWSDHGVRRLCVVGLLMMGGFVACYNYLTYRLTSPPIQLSRTITSLLFLAYLGGTVSSSVAGRLARRYGHRKVLCGAVVLAAGGLALTLPDQIVCITIGLFVFTVGFFAVHSVASGWVAARSPGHGSQASALYLMSYYLGSSILGTLIGQAYLHGGWSMTVAVICLLCLGALAAGAGVRDRADATATLRGQALPSEEQDSRAPHELG